MALAERRAGRDGVASVEREAGAGAHRTIALGATRNVLEKYVTHEAGPGLSHQADWAAAKLCSTWHTSGLLHWAVLVHVGTMLVQPRPSDG